MSLEPVPTASLAEEQAGPASIPVADRGREDAPFPLVPVVLMGAGAVTLGAGVTVGLLGYADARDAPTRDGEQADAARRQMMIGDIVAGVGGAVALAGAVWLIVELTTDSDDAADSVGWSSWSDGGAGGLQLTF